VEVWGCGASQSRYKNQPWVVCFFAYKIVHFQGAAARHQEVAGETGGTSAASEVVRL